MPCYHPLTAWRTESGGIVIGNRAQGSTQLFLPCGKCIGCSKRTSQGWALRGLLEMQEHDAAAFTTLTYAPKYEPPTLQRRDLSAFLKRLRTNRARSGATAPIRFLASGEYGDRYRRPHYHAILFGVRAEERADIEAAWRLGIVHTVTATPAAICYTAGYVTKKACVKDIKQERIDPHTGEVYTYQPPFLQMSRRPGIGGHARKWPQTWRDYAVMDGTKMPVPRYLHEAWKAQATPEQIKQLQEEKLRKIIELLAETGEEQIQQLEAGERMAEAMHKMQREKRKLH